jgi:hypothetical protein
MRVDYADANHQRTEIFPSPPYPPIDRFHAPTKERSNSLGKRLPMISTAEKIFETAKRLPDSLALEALHYLEYLQLRARDRSQTLDLMCAQQDSLQHIWDNNDDEVWNDASAR